MEEPNLFTKPKKKGKMKPLKEPKKKEVVSKGSGLILNEDQAKAIELMKKFKSSEDKHFTLEGRGGTGKTTVIRELCLIKKQRCDEYFIPANVVGVVVTHTARIELSKSIPNSITYASATDQQMGFDSNGNIYFYPNTRTNVFNPLSGMKYIVIDECSMFSQDMIDLLINCADHDAKFIWMGDHHQLNPIGTNGDDSPAFHFENKFELKIKMRQYDESHIANLCDDICNHIDTDHDLSFIDEIKTQFDTSIGKGYSLSNMNS